MQRPLRTSNTLAITSLLSLSAALPCAAMDVSLSGLYGDNYAVEPERQATATLEVVAWGSWGDLFSFVDYKSFPGSDAANSWYGEIAPRFKLIDGEMPLYAAFTYERGKGDTEAYLGGLGTDFKVQGFKFLKANVYYRDSPNHTGHGWQTTVSWAYPFANEHWVIDGYIDWVFSTEETEPHLHFNPQIKWDMQKALGSSMRWYVGLEYDYWYNKFGIDNDILESRQNTASLLVKLHF
ncbi:DUF5020 family protein [Simiduia sp. 21SJ11W-1]|uniref:DUF5020 family protein n=1 Tax=Simiduia sp. 21SJ11W-1 TaxID=2909669 RepID=UPI00209EAD2D|nr:DUF5020 family protein [Simiduia sp. 21SJ11W-1]UTA46970.1 DUF5020 family protein [Simiduia sp. 21SJ11W-1]